MILDNFAVSHFAGEGIETLEMQVDVFVNDDNNLITEIQYKRFTKESRHRLAEFAKEACLSQQVAIDKYINGSKEKICEYMHGCW